MAPVNMNQANIAFVNILSVNLIPVNMVPIYMIPVNMVSDIRVYHIFHVTKLAVFLKVNTLPTV